MSHKTNRKAVAKLEAIYARLPKVACRGLCSVACGPLPMTLFEAARLRVADPQRRTPMTDEHNTCVYLTPSQRCGVYSVRPLICRVWGVLKSLSCMHGCIPDRWLGEHEFVEIAQAIERLGGPMVRSIVNQLAPSTDTFLDIDVTSISEEQVAVLAERTRNLRALHGGRIVGIYPANGEPKWVNLDREPK